MHSLPQTNVEAVVRTLRRLKDTRGTTPIIAKLLNWNIPLTNVSLQRAVRKRLVKRAGSEPNLYNGVSTGRPATVWEAA